jgi:DNA end-binding protein Ku
MHQHAKVDADTGEEVASEDIIKGHKSTPTPISRCRRTSSTTLRWSRRNDEIDDSSLSDIDNRYLIRPYYLVPDGKVGHDAFAVIRETIRSMNKVAIGRGTDQPRAHHCAGAARQGPDGTLLRHLRGAQREGIFRRHPGGESHQDMLDLARHIVEKKSGSFEPERSEDRYESALIDLINQKRNGVRTTAKAAPKSSGNVINLMDALKRSPPARSSPPSRQGQGQETAQARRRPARDAAAHQRQTRKGRAEEGREAGARACPIEKGGIGVRALVAAQDESGRKRRGFATSAAAGLRCHGRRRSMSRLRSAAVASSQRCSTPPITS